MAAAIGVWAALAVLTATPTWAQDGDEDLQPQAPIEADQSGPTDREIARRLQDIFAEREPLSAVTVTVEAGVVRLEGTVADLRSIEEAARIAARVTGVVTVENEIERDYSVERRIAPAIDMVRDAAREMVAMAPLAALAAVVFAVIAWLGWLITGATALWRWITPNLFIAELTAKTVRLAFLVAAIIAALRVLDATTLLGAVLGAAGVLGLAIGFSVRDTIENYIASIMLSLRQPFRPKDHVVINGHEGLVIRLTSRATVLLTLDGNHLRLPNADVFKASILNYTRNPERRFAFKLGIDASDDPLAAIEAGVATLKGLDFVRADPPPFGIIEDVGDSNIVLFFAAWIDQRTTDFGKARSAALAATKNHLEATGFALPEPIYRLRFDDDALGLREAVAQAAPLPGPKAPREGRLRDDVPRQRTSPEAVDTETDHRLEEQIDEERK
ncbi:MAG: mechanosensitive ion channel domain-containing protein, partial [Pseudomonadota bacterium]